MNLVNFYYNFNVGEYPEEKEYMINTEKVFNHMLDAGIKETEIVELIIGHFDNKLYLTFEDIPEDLWNNSLLKKDTFYYHTNLQILSPAPTWDKTYPFYREMKIRYTENDLLEYFIKTFSINKDWTNIDKEIGSIKYLINKYQTFNFIEPIDFILLLIDFVKSKGIKAYKIYDICDFEIEFAQLLELDIKNSKDKNKNTIIWR